MVCIQQKERKYKNNFKTTIKQKHIYSVKENQEFVNKL